MKNFVHPKTYTVIFKNTDQSYSVIQTSRSGFYNNLLVTSLKDKYTASLWLSRFAIYTEEVLLKS